MHQIVTGTSGYDEYDLCLSRPSMGRFSYAQNILHGWSQVHADKDSLRVVSRGVDPVTKEVKDLFEIEILNKTERTEEFTQ